MNGRQITRETSANQRNAQRRRATEQTDGRKGKETLTAKAANGSLSNDGSNGRDNIMNDFIFNL